MGLLATLDYHNKLALSDRSKIHAKIEYRLLSWGEIFSPFIGDREHSVAARYILHEYPFKLFCTSMPYNDPMPQKLTLTFLAPHVVMNESEHLHSSGIIPHEIAEEFAAFLSVVTRRRVFVAHQTRYDELPMEQEAYFYEKSPSQERQMLKEIDPEEIYQLLDNLLRLERRIAEGFVLAIRLYHTAIQMMFTEPEFSYLLLITCLEAISSAVIKNYEPDNINNYLDSRFPGMQKIINLLDAPSQLELKKIILKNENFTYKKFSKFIKNYLSDEFWTETSDDAKPDYLQGVIGVGKEGKGELRISHSDKALQPYEIIEKDKLEKTLRNIYSARSELVHSGVRFPPSIVLGHYRLVPAGVLNEMITSSMGRGVIEPPKIPPLQTFERMTSFTLTNYLKTTKLG